MRYRTTLDSQVFAFDDLKQVMAFASPARSGDYLAGIGAATAQQRMAARHVLAQTPLQQYGFSATTVLACGATTKRGSWSTGNTT